MLERPGFIFFPGCRASAYLDMMQRLTMPPACIVLMQNPMAERGIQAASSHPLVQRFYQPVADIEAFCQQFNVPLIVSSAQSINDTELTALLLRQGCSHWLFSGGGIVQSTVLATGLKFLHVHPGQMPEVRGSTCFYYSLLHDLTLAASAFFLEAELDAGPSILCRHFHINIPPALLSSDFIDYIVDPYIRAETLRPLWQHWPDISDLDKVAKLSTPPSDRPCYVMHPVLRAMAIQRVAASYNANNETGVFHYA